MEFEIHCEIYHISFFSNFIKASQGHSEDRRQFDNLKQFDTLLFLLTSWTLVEHLLFAEVVFDQLTQKTGVNIPLIEAHG